MTTTDEDHLNALYTDRAHILALLALHYPSYLAYSDTANPDWPVLTLELPTGQASWHIAKADLPLFAHVRDADQAEATAAYDGHTTDEKNARIRQHTGNYTPLSGRL